MRRQGGFSKFEFSVVFAVIGVVSLAGIDRMIELQELGEKTAVESTIRNIQSGLQYEMAHHLTQGEESRIAGMVGSNPVRWLEQPPAGYRGEFGGSPAVFAPGDWYFDSLRRELVYRPRLGRNLQIDGAEGNMRWRIEPAGGAVQTAPATRVRAVATVAYRWF